MLYLNFKPFSKMAAYMIIICATASSAVRADYEKGLTAYKAKNYPLAMTEFTSGNAVGNALAQERVAYMYRKGRGVAKDKEEAIKWYRLSAEQGYAKAQFELGFMLWGKGGISSRKFKSGALVKGGYKYTVKGDDKNQVESYKWVNLAAEQGGSLGMGNAKMMRVDMQINLDGMTQLRGERAIDAYLGRQELIGLNARADAGSFAAQYALGMRYYEGDGVRKNKTIAYHWLNLAYYNGMEDARKLASKMCSKLRAEKEDRLGPLSMQYMIVEYFEEHPEAFVGSDVKSMLKTACEG